MLYSNSDQFTWNMQYQPYSQEYVDAFYKHVEPGSHTYTAPGRYMIAVKVIDIFGTDAMTLVPIAVG